MSLPPFHPAAERELNDEAEYYEGKTPGLGGDFLAEVRMVAIDAAKNPEQGSSYGSYARRRPLHRFPHWLVYLSSEDGIRVVAIAHPSRKPGYWKGRI